MIKINNGFDTFIDAAGKTLEVAPNLYDDTIHPTAKESGKTLSLIPKTINAALVPLRQWIAKKEYNMAETEKLLAYKLEHLDPEKIVSPEPYVAVPALQAISYSMDNSQLRNLYANLIANSMNVDIKDSVHPSFVEIIKQLSPLDAQVFDIICNNTVNPMIHIKRVKTKGNGSIYLTKNITLLNITTEDLLSISIDNLERLNLIEIPYGASYTTESLYQPFFNLNIYKNYEQAYATSTDYKIDVDKRVINVTNMGRSFHNICVKDI